MARRKVRDEAEAVALIEEARRRGVKPSDVALERGISGRSVQGWSLVLSKRESGPCSSIMELVPLTVAASRARSYRVWIGELAVECENRTLVNTRIGSS